MSRIVKGSMSLLLAAAAVLVLMGATGLRPQENAVADSSAQVSGPVIRPAVDLALSNLKFKPRYQLLRNGQLKIKVKISNLSGNDFVHGGTLGSESFATILFYFSADTTLDVSDPLIGFVVVETIRANSSRVVKVTLRVPSDPLIEDASYYVIAILDPLNLVNDTKGNEVAVSKKTILFG